MNDKMWCLVDDEGTPVAGPFDSAAEASAHDPYDDRFTPGQVTRTEWSRRWPEGSA